MYSIRKEGRGGPSDLYRHRKIAPSVKIPYSLLIELGHLPDELVSAELGPKSRNTIHRAQTRPSEALRPTGYGDHPSPPLATGHVDLSIGGRGRVVPFLTHHLSLTHMARALGGGGGKLKSYPWPRQTEARHWISQERYANSATHSKIVRFYYAQDQ